jgi:DNA-binding NtrC family response regulator
MSQRGADILVVDDEPGLREFLSDSLELAGHRVATADSAERALALVAQRRFDLVMTDLSMPGQGGMALVRALGARAGSPALVVLTAHGTVEVAVEAMRHGAVDFIQKPVASPDALCDRIGAILRRRGGGGPSGPGAPTLGYGDPAMRPVEEAVAKVARTDATVLLLGESGTGKEVCARTIHAHSARRRRAVDGGQLRGAGRHAARERAVRAREGGVHRRDRAQARPARAGRRGHLLPRRDRRAAPEPAGQAAAGAAGAAPSSVSAAPAR